MGQTTDEVSTYISVVSVEALIIRGDGMNLKEVFTPAFWRYLQHRTRSAKVRAFCEAVLSEWFWKE